MTHVSSYSDWVTHQHRDTLSTIVGHPALTSYLAIADGEAIGRLKFEMTEVWLGRLSVHGANMLGLADASTLRSTTAQR